MKRDADRNNIKMPLVTMLLRDGTLYFAAMLALGVLDAVGNVSNAFTYTAYFITPSACASIRETTAEAPAGSRRSSSRTSSWTSATSRADPRTAPSAPRRTRRSGSGPSSTIWESSSSRASTRPLATSARAVQSRLLQSVGRFRAREVLLQEGRILRRLRRSPEHNFGCLTGKDVTSSDRNSIRTHSDCPTEHAVCLAWPSWNYLIRVDCYSLGSRTGHDVCHTAGLHGTESVAGLRSIIILTAVPCTLVRIVQEQKHKQYASFNSTVG